MKKYILLFYLVITFNTLLVAQVHDKPLIISHLTDNFYVYTTYRILNNSPFPSNSMYLVTENSVILFDTPWDTTRFQPLLDSIEQRHHKQVIMCIVTHFHDDRTAGLDFFKNKGIATWSSKLTYDLCKEQNEKQARFFFTHDTTFNIGSYSFQTFYAGPGHTHDNLVIWFGKYKILYAGCLVKSAENNTLGNIKDANIAEWPKTIKKMMKKFPDPKYVIPGHFGWTDNTASAHTLKLLREYEKSK